MSAPETQPERTRASPGGRSRLLWWWTIGSGAALVVLVTVHMVAHHFVVNEVGGLRTYRQVLEYIGNPVILAVECLLLVVVTIHAMLGVRSVLSDLDLRSAGRRRIDRALVLVGITTVVYGFVLLGILASRA
jgi:succinate dehydrogenase hydrophobic anchor subunit